MKKIMLALIIMLMLTACAPTPRLAPTPTITPEPTSTIAPERSATNTPTNMPAPSLIPTIQIDIAATETKLQSDKDFFSDEVIRRFNDVMGCVLATWEENSFEVVCAMVSVDNEQELIEVAYKLTYGLTNQMLGMDFDFCFDESFTFIVALVSSDEQWLLRAVTPGNVLRMLVDGKIESSEIWMDLATVDPRKNDN